MVGVRYSHLCGVLRASSSDLDSQARIALKAVVPGLVVTRTGFDLGAWINTTPANSVNLFTLGGGAALFSFTGDASDGLLSLPTHFSPKVSTVGRLWNEWQDSAFDVGIDNIEFSVDAVPKPATALLMLAGVAGWLLVLRRR